MDEDETLEVMEGSLEGDILEGIPGNVPRM